MNKKKAQQSSKSRQQILINSNALSKLLSKIISIKSITKGSIYNQKKKCGNPNCKCVQGKFLHTTRLLSFSHQGKTKLIPLTKYPILELSAIEQRVQHYQQFRYCRAQIVYYCKLLISEINKLEKSLLLEVIPKKGETDDTNRTREKST